MIGIVGGVGPHAGLHLHKRILDLTDSTCDQDHLPVLHINCASEIPDRTEFLLGKIHENPAMGITAQIRALTGAGAKIIAIPCNTAHSSIIYDEIINQSKESSDYILLNIIDELFEKIVQSGEKRTGLLATTGSYKSRVFEQYAARYNVEIVLPDHKDQLAIHDTVYNLNDGIKVTGKMSNRINTVYKELFERYRKRNVKSAILGCTEISMALSPIKHHDFQVYETVDILAAALIREYLKPIRCSSKKVI